MYTTGMHNLLSLYAFVIGLCFGSFALATAWRLKKKKRFTGRERSVCEHCGHVLQPQDLIPLVSWLSLGGKCRYCQKKLSWLLPFAELLGGGFFALSYMFWPDTTKGFLGVALFVLWLIGLVLLLVLFLYDAQWYLLPNKVMYPLWVVSGASFAVRFAQVPNLHTVVLGLMAVAVGAGFFWLMHTVSKGRWIGFGDVRLGLAIGLFVGTPLLAALVIFLASVIGVIVAMPGLIARSRKLTSKLPFGPLLIIALVLVRLFGQKVIDWYAAQFLFL